ncbi:MAG: SnoaL-like polyketide cyclase, partial [Gammaproteobacteria bacterium]
MENEENTGPIQIQDREFVLYADPEIEWRYGKRPDYTKTNKTLRAQSKKFHEKGSLEEIVQNLVRTFEMEATYKLNPEQWSSIDSAVFRMKTNNGPEYSAADIVENGTYNLFLDESEYYSSKAENFESSSTIFKEAFTTGFVWEVVEVYAGPPKVVFKWRHWGTHEGKFQEYSATDKLIEVFGVTIADVNEELKL